MALGLAPLRLDIRPDFPKDCRWARPGCAPAGCPVHDTVEKTWRYLKFFPHEAYPKARAPRGRCADRGVRQVSVPWARDGPGFTLLFEALIMKMMTRLGFLVNMIVSLIENGLGPSIHPACSIAVWSLGG